MTEEKMVETVKGITVPISKCRKFGNDYYLIGDPNVEDSGDCQLIGDRYYRLETNQVVFDHAQQKHILKNDMLYHGVVKLVDDAPVFGAFSPDENINSIVTLKDGNVVRALNYDLFEGSKTYRERLSDGRFYHIDRLKAIEFSRVKPPTQDYKTSLPYDARFVIDEYLETYNKLEVEILPNTAKFAPILKDLTFGLEFETIAGILPQRILNKTGLIPLRDGSIQGIEYVTVPMQGEKGLQVTLNAVKELEYRTRYDHTCALHMHIGNIPRTIEFILAFFKLTCAIQDEIYTLFPLYKKYNFGVKNKNYSKPFPTFQLISQMDPIINSSNIIRNFDVLYTYLSMGQRFGDVNNKLENVLAHPADREGRAKWHINTRYYIHNLIPLIFGNKQTIEFRIHTATLDVDKIAYFMFMNASIVNFAIENTDMILRDPGFLTRDVNLYMILNNQAQRTLKKTNTNYHICDLMAEYFDRRRRKTESQNKEGNIRGNEDDIIVSSKVNWFQKARLNKPLEEAPFNEEIENHRRAYKKIEQDLLEGKINQSRYDSLKKHIDVSYKAVLSKNKVSLDDFKF